MEIIEDISENEIAACLMRGYLQSFFLPKYTPPGWWECDVCEFTKAGYFREYEIKLSVSDFRVDSQKSQNINNKYPSWAKPKDPADYRTKHASLAQSEDNKGPAQFWFVCPKGMLELDVVPAWAGLIEIQKSSHHTAYGYRLFPSEKKKAPRLHRSRPPEGYKKNAESACYYRLHSRLQKCLPPQTHKENGERFR